MRKWGQKQNQSKSYNYLVARIRMNKSMITIAWIYVPFSIVFLCKIVQDRIKKKK